MIKIFLVLSVFISLVSSGYAAGDSIIESANRLSSRPAVAERMNRSFSLNNNDMPPARENWLDNRRLFRDLYGGGKILVDDFIYIYSSPARLNNKSVLWLAGITAVGGVIYAFDQEIYDAFLRNKDHKIYRPVRKLGENFERLGFMGYTNKFYVGAMALGYILKYEPLVTIPAEILEAHLIEGAAKNVANFAAGRHRPYENDGPYFFKLNDGSSFPSGHAAVVVQVADVVSYRIDFLPLSIGLYSVATAVCLERITSEAHWPSDVYLAAVYGWAVSHALLKYHDRKRANVNIASFGDAVGLRFKLAF
jgi:hypothetical protein